MDLVVSAIAGDLVKRFISFMIKKYESQANLERKMKRLQHLLLKVHMIVNEAEGRCITNSMMLLQLKKIVEAMYEGYHVLDIIKHRTLCSSKPEEEVSRSNTLSNTTFYGNPFCIGKSAIRHDQLQSTLDSLETIVSSMTEFVFLLGGCERMSRRPYDMYLYFDNFMFGRQVEKQQLINILLQENLPPSAPTVLPIIGPSRVGKRTLVAHVCNNEIVQSHFSSILHLHGENIRKMERGTFAQRRILVVVEFTADMDDDIWRKFYLSSTHMGWGSKIIIISRIERVSRFGTVRPINLNSLSLGEYSYLFKVLAFGSTNAEEHPQLVFIANELSVLLGGSFLSANVCANVFRKNQDVHFWFSVLKKHRFMVQKNFLEFREHPKLLFEKEHQVDITIFAPSSSPLRLMPPSEGGKKKRELSQVMFEDLITDPILLPKEDFELVWESRIPPYRRFVSIASYHEDEQKTSQHVASPCKKRQKLDK
uniref:Disease resistance N-terminal domain-containing protein n=1 Tax=Leersia perrieri TaxID=77586 RepID=A0A0D9XHL2_9ORYZ